MVEIIKQGTPPDLYEATCEHCDTVFQFSESERSKYLDSIPCPVCKHAAHMWDWVNVLERTREEAGDGTDGA